VKKTYFDPWQNPTYPQDQDLTDDEVGALARQASLARAQSPGPLTCQIDGTWSLDDQFHHDSYQLCMDFRHRHVIGDNEAWTFWQLVDGPLIGPKPPVPPLPVGLMGWQTRTVAGVDVPPGTAIPIVPPTQPGAAARVWAMRAQMSGLNTTWTAVTDSFGNPITNKWGNPVYAWNAPSPTGSDNGYNGLTVACIMIPNYGGIIPVKAAYATRITLIGSFTLGSLYMGTRDIAHDPTGLSATNMHQFTFWTDDQGNPLSDPNDPKGSHNPFVKAIMDDQGNFVPVVSDPLTVGFDATNGWIISFFLRTDGNGILGSLTQNYSNDYSAYVDEPLDPVTGTIIYGQDSAGNVTKTTYIYGNRALLGVFTVEGLYDPQDVPTYVKTSPS
jgi:hypothetical protein